MDAFFIYTNNLQETINFCYLISAKLVKKKIIQFASNLFQSKIQKLKFWGHKADESKRSLQICIMYSREDLGKKEKKKKREKSN